MIVHCKAGVAGAFCGCVLGCARGRTGRRSTGLAIRASLLMVSIAVAAGCSLACDGCFGLRTGCMLRAREAKLGRLAEEGVGTANGPNKRE